MSKPSLVPEKQVFKEFLPNVILEFPDFVIIIKEPLSFKLNTKNNTMSSPSNIEIDFTKYMYLTKDQMAEFSITESEEEDYDDQEEDEFLI